ncbi:uncharacterized protein TRUGW13939_09013 [Talaromyces rugulosus]|uniref:NmrA-like domain-containing protein n=1 Tax=Talaromyces rugulosus TaxID=121627 RepID=A0A7H8R6L9_TALRU|nr:uncharacterized protein TRUGW13939_09013 [Talaromyces rugulosus]QKX61857.1 hypothetical protein TRUGW13939_09013 [Talaromyces rugulosus]
MAPIKNILVIGAGELGNQVLRFLADHPQRQGAVVSVLLRPASIASTKPDKKSDIDTLRELGIQIVAGDVAQDTEQSLSSTFASHDTIISCMGFASGRGTQVKLTRAVLSAGIPRYIPWQFGIDYDIIGRGSAQELFDEQLDVRDLLRAQTQTSWAIVSTGIFTSFFFEPGFGVVDVHKGTVCALGGWENRVTLTTAEDIGKVTADIVFDEQDQFANKPIFIGGDTISYGDLAELVEKVTGKTVQKTVLKVDDAQAALATDPENNLLKYQIVWGQGRGVSWDLSATWNWKRGITMTTAEEWAAKNLV